MIYKDSSKPIHERVEDLIARMTLEEKAAQLCGDLPAACVAGGKVDLDRIRSKFSEGLGRITQFSMVGLVEAKLIAKISNAIQRYFIEETRLGIPVAFQSENLSGYPAASGTVFPSMLNVACTWEPELVEKMSAIIGQESKAVGINSAMSPVIDVSRDPRWGRTYETFGEDHYLTSQFGIHYVSGMQRQGISCIAKHFLGYAETQGGLNTAQTRINDRELYEVFATPFEAADKVAGLGGMMASYSEIDGLPVGVNKDIARKLLREKMGFEGMLISDGGAVWKIYDFFKVCKTYKEAGLMAKKGGLDTEIPVGGAYRQLPDYVRSGELDETLIDESVRRILTIKFQCGLFENPYIVEDQVDVVMSNDHKKAFSEEIARKSIVLLKNDEHLLPFKKGLKVGVIGPHGDNLRYPVSGYTYPAYIEMLDASRSSSNASQVTFNGIMDEEKKSNDEQKVTTEKKEPGPFATLFNILSDEQIRTLSDMNTVLKKIGSQSLREVLSERFQVHYARGCDIMSDEIDDLDNVLKAVESSDVIVMAMGGNCGWVNVTGGEGKDRARLDLPGVQQQLLEKVVQMGKPVVLVLYGPGVFSIPWAVQNVTAIVQAFMPGPYAGKAVTDILDGTYCPEGKLPVTIPRSVGQIPLFYNHKVGSGYTSKGDEMASAIFTGGYTDENDRPLFPFGFGLSYTKFKIESTVIKAMSVPTYGEIVIDVQVKNQGDLVGAEVVQVYYHFKDAKVTRPNKQLAAFAKITLEPYETRKISFKVPVALLGFYNEEMEFVVEPGAMDIMIGTSAENTAFKQEIALVGEKQFLSGRRKYSSIVEYDK